MKKIFELTSLSFEFRTANFSYGNKVAFLLIFPLESYFRLALDSLYTSFRLALGLL